MRAAVPASYWREYRKKHKARLNAQLSARRKTRRAEDPAWVARRNAEEQRRRAARREAVETLALMPYTGHPLLERAREIAGTAWYGTHLYDPTKEDAAGEAVLALLEGRDPEQAVQAFYAQERRRGALRVGLEDWQRWGEHEGRRWA